MGLADSNALQVSIELLSNLIYLARRSEKHSAEQHAYLDRAAEVVEEMANHPPIVALGRILEAWRPRPISCG